MLQAIIFDFDGVIVDSEPLHYRAFLETVRGFGIDFTYEEYLDRYIGYDDRDGFDAILRDYPVDVSLKTNALITKKADAFERLANEHVTAIPGVIDLIRTASETMPIAIASGASRRDLTLMLAALGLSDRFTVVVSADDVAKSKPHPQSYADALARLSALHPNLPLSPETTLAIEDTTAGVASARDAGLLTLGLSHSPQAHAALTEAQANRVVDSLTDVNLAKLHEWFDQ